jgi:hypothetical protein
MKVSVPRIRLSTLGGALAMCIASAAPGFVQADSPFKGPPPGFRALALSSAMVTFMVPETTTPRDSAVQRAYVDQINQRVEQPVVVSAGDCAGDGTTPDRAVKVSGITRPEDEIGRGIACALAQHPGARLAPSVETVLITDNVRTLLTVNLFDAAGKPVQVYTDATHFAAAVPAP